MGGVDQLLELVETGVGITEHKTRNYPLAIYYGEDDLPEVRFGTVDVCHWTVQNLYKHTCDRMESTKSAYV